MMTDIVMENMNRWVVVRPRHCRDEYEPEYDFWSNDMGWVDLDSATFFDFSEVQSARLPIAGAWLPVRRAYGWSLR